jgi:hypothetical protein
MLSHMAIVFSPARFPAIIILLTVVPLCWGCLAPPDVREIDREPGLVSQRALIAGHFGATDVTASRVATARAGLTAVSAAWWGFDREDSTAGLQAALDSGAAVVLVPRMETPWISSRLYIRSNTTLILEEGVVLLAKRGSFQNPGDAFLNVVDAHDITVSGYGAIIRMWKTDYAAPPYKKGEWRSALAMWGGRRITLLGLTAESSGGDGVYLGRSKTRIVNTDIHLKDLVLRDHYRQGVSVITVVNLLIENTELGGTSGTAPSAGIDFEPNRADEPIKNCRLKNCLIRNNAGAGLLVYFRRYKPASEPFDITLEDCTVYGNLVGTYVTGFENGARGRLDLIRTRMYGLKLLPSAPGQFEYSEQ